jgi:hypothetical protein
VGINAEPSRRTGTGNAAAGCAADRGATTAAAGTAATAAPAAEIHEQLAPLVSNPAAWHDAYRQLSAGARTALDGERDRLDAVRHAPPPEPPSASPDWRTPLGGKPQ